MVELKWRRVLALVVDKTESRVCINIMWAFDDCWRWIDLASVPQDLQSRIQKDIWLICEAAPSDDPYPSSDCYLRNFALAPELDPNDGLG